MCNRVLSCQSKAGRYWALLLVLCASPLAASWDLGGDDYLFGLPPQAPADNACIAQLKREQHTPRDTLFDAEFETYLALVEKSMTYRAETIAYYAQLKAQLDRGEPLSGAELDTINQGMADHLHLREALLDIAHRHECWLYADTRELRNNGLNERQRLEGVMLSLSAALMLYDNYLLAISIYEDDGRLRPLLNQSDRGYGVQRGQLAEVSISYANALNRARVRRGIQFYEQAIGNYDLERGGQSQLAYLNRLIGQSPSYNMTKKWSPLYVLGNGINLFGDVTADALEELGRDGLNLFSMAFGNTVGMVEMRKGKLYGHSDVSQRLHQQMQAGDILLEKTPFRLTDQFIPGHWGHAAIWIGNEQELRALGLWDHPLVQPHQAEIRTGQGVIEALRSGVTLNTIEHFLNVDDMAVLRSRQSDQAQRAKIVLQAFRQLGKAYDFNFDVETTDRIVCSELIYHTYTGIQWPTEKTLGRSTISPDNVAAKALDDGPLQLVVLYHDGEPVNEQKLVRMAGYMGRSVPQ